MASKPSRVIVALAGALGLCLSIAPVAAGPTLDPSRLAQLARYEVLVFSDPFKDGIERGKAIGVFDATPEEVFRVASDFNKWSEYLPKVHSSKVVSRSGKVTLVAMTADLPWPVGRRQVFARYIEDRLPGEIYRIRFEMLHGEMRQYLGSLYIEPWNGSGPPKTAVTYELVAEPDIAAPDSTINKAVRRSSSGFVHALRQHVNELHRLGLLHPMQPPTVAPPVALPQGPVTVKATP